MSSQMPGQVLRATEVDTDGGVHLQGKVVLYGEQRASRPTGSLRFVADVPNKMSDVNFLVTGLILLSLPL